MNDNLYAEIAQGQGEKLSLLALRLPSARQGRPVSLACVARWVRHGVRLSNGDVVRLEAARLAGRTGRPYREPDLDYFWTRLLANSSFFDDKFQLAIAQREPSKSLQREVMDVFGRAGVFTLTGRLRARAAYCARHNTVFQGLAADGAKIALWKLWRSGYRIANFVHDEFLIEVPTGSDLKVHAERIRDLLIEGMTAVVPNVKLDVSYGACARWYKEAETRYDGTGQLVMWEPVDQAACGAG
jgi:hypothetical protein